MVGVGAVIVEILGDTTGLSASLAAAGAQITAFGAGMRAVGLGMSALVTAPILGVGYAALASANTYAKAYATIRAETGTTGVALAGLKGEFDKLFKAVPNAAQDIAKSLSTVFMRLRGGGYDIDHLTHQILDMSRMTGESADTMSNKVSAMFNAWKIPASGANEAMNQLWRVSQSAAVSVTKLATDMDTYSMVLQEAGISQNDAIVIMGAMEASGLDVTRSVQGMAYGWANVAKMMAAPTKTTQATVDALNASMAAAGITGRTTGDMLKGAFYGIQHGMIGDADAAAIFGPRFAANITGEIKRGTFSAEAFSRALALNHDTIDAAGKQTLTFAQRVEILKHNLESALQPLGFAIINALESAWPAIQGTINFISNLVRRFTELPGPIRNAGVYLAILAAGVGPVLVATGMLVGAVGKITSGVGSMLTVINKWGGAAATATAANTTQAASNELVGDTAAASAIKQTTLADSFIVNAGAAGTDATAQTTLAGTTLGAGDAAAIAAGEYTELTFAETAAAGGFTEITMAAIPATAAVEGAGTAAVVAGGESLAAAGEVGILGVAFSSLLLPIVIIVAALTGLFLLYKFVPPFKSAVDGAADSILNLGKRVADLPSQKTVNIEERTTKVETKTAAASAQATSTKTSGTQVVDKDGNVIPAGTDIIKLKPGEQYVNGQIIAAPTIPQYPVATISAQATSISTAQALADKKTREDAEKRTKEFQEAHNVKYSQEGLGSWWDENIAKPFNKAVEGPYVQYPGKPPERMPGGATLPTTKELGKLPPGVQPLPSLGEVGQGISDFFLGKKATAAEFGKPQEEQKGIDWGKFITNIDWGKYIPGLSWLSFILKLDWGSMISKIDWGGWITRINWGGWISNIDWGRWIPGLSWATWLIHLDWGSYLNPLNWFEHIKGIDWGGFIPHIDWGWFIPHLSLGGITHAAGQAVEAAAAVAAPVVQAASTAGSWLSGVGNWIGGGLHSLGIGANGLIGLQGGASYMATKPQLALIGESGPEAVIPRKYWWAIPPWVLNALPRLQGGGLGGLPLPGGFNMPSFGWSGGTYNASSGNVRDVQINFHIKQANMGSKKEAEQFGDVIGQRANAIIRRSGGARG